MARQSYCRRLAQHRHALRVSADPLAKPAAHTRAGKPGFLTYESGFGRETDSPLERTGFELSVPRCDLNAAGLTGLPGRQGRNGGIVG